MKKLIVALALLAAGCGAASAQDEIFNNPDNQAYFGVRASLDITSPGDWKVGNISANNFDNGVGFSVGAIYNVPIYYNLYFEPGVSLYRHNAKAKAGILDDTKKVKLGEYGFAVPLIFGYHFDFENFKLYAFTGPEFTIGISGKMKCKDDEDWDKSKSMYGDSGCFNRANAYWRFGAGISYEQYYLSISGAAGLTNWLDNKIQAIQTGDILSNEKVTMHRNTVSITLGYNF